MNVLLIDTATEACSVALQVGEKQYHSFEICPQQHSQRLLPMLDEVLQQAGIRLEQLDYLGFGRGPGSFTGVRIATGMLQGLALGTGLPAVGVSTLAAMAQQAITESGAMHIVAATDARMAEVYFAQYRNIDGVAQLFGEEQVLPPQQALAQITESQFTAVGTGWDSYPELGAVASNIKVLYPAAKYMLPLAIAAIGRGEARDVEDIQPVYLRDKVTWKKLPGKE